MTEYVPILVMAMLATVFVVGSFAASRALAPHSPTAAKRAPYECGIVPEREPADRFSVKFALVAMAFIMFDVELVFLYAWATVFRRLELFGLVAMGIFLVPLLVAYCYELSSGSLDWGPSRAAKRAPQPVQRIRAGSRDNRARRVPAGGTCRGHR